MSWSISESLVGCCGWQPIVKISEGSIGGLEKIVQVSCRECGRRDLELVSWFSWPPRGSLRKLIERWNAEAREKSER